MLIKDENKAVRNRLGLYNGMHCIKLLDHMSFQNSNFQNCFKTVFVYWKSFKKDVWSAERLVQYVLQQYNPLNTLYFGDPHGLICISVKN